MPEMPERQDCGGGEDGAGQPGWRKGLGSRLGSIYNQKGWEPQLDLQTQGKEISCL